MSRSLARRARWRFHWLIRPHARFRVRHWFDGMTIELPHAGAAAQIYYRGFSSPGVAAVVCALAPTVEVFVDVGAHAGEYSLLAARRSRGRARVIAVEPQESFAHLIAHNARRNDVSVEVRREAVGDRVGTLSFATDAASGGAWLAPEKQQGTVDTTVTTLDEILADTPAASVLLKLDAAGHEAGALRGAEHLLADERLRAIVYKLYHPDVVRERADIDVDVIADMAGRGFNQWLWADGWRVVRCLADVMDALNDRWYSAPVFASRRLTPPDS